MGKHTIERFEGVIRDACDFLSDSLPVDNEDFNVSDLCMSLTEYKEACEVLKEVKASLEKVVSFLSYKAIPERMEREDITSLTCTDGRKYYMTTRGTATIKDEAAAFDWLRANGGEQLIKETVHRGSLAAFMKEYQEAEGKEGDGIEFQTVSFVTSRKG